MRPSGVHPAPGAPNLSGVLFTTFQTRCTQHVGSFPCLNSTPACPALSSGGTRGRRAGCQGPAASWGGDLALGARRFPAPISSSPRSELPGEATASWRQAYECQARRGGARRLRGAGRARSPSQSHSAACSSRDGRVANDRTPDALEKVCGEEGGRGATPRIAA